MYNKQTYKEELSILKAIKSNLQKLEVFQIDNYEGSIDPYVEKALQQVEEQIKLATNIINR